MKKDNMQMITKLMFRLLPVQVLLAAVGSVNGIVSGYFAANYVGIDAMSAVSLYGPLSMFLGALGTEMLPKSFVQLLGSFSFFNIHVFCCIHFSFPYPS